MISNYTKILLVSTFFFSFFLFNSYAQSEWTQTSTPPNGSISAIETIGDNIFAGATSGGVYFSDNNGASWIQRNGEFPNMEVLSLAVNGTDIYAGTGGSTVGVYKSSNNGLNWTDVTPSAFTNNETGVMSIVIDNNSIYIGAGDPDTGIFKSSLDNISVSSWSSFSSGLVNKSIRSLKINGNLIYAGTYGDGVWVSPTDNVSWNLTSTTMPINSDYIQTIEVNGNNIFAGNISGLPVLYRSVDNGFNWIQSNTSIFNDEAVYAIKSNNNNIYAGTEGEGMFFSADDGLTWSQFNEGFRDGSGNWFCNHINIRSIAFSDTQIFAGTDCGIWTRSLTILGLDNFSVNNLFLLYPNPNNGKFKIDAKLDPIVDVEIFNTNGKKIFSAKGLSQYSKEIDISDSPKGIYFIKIYSVKSTQTKKLIVN